ncbi:MAG: MBL fold metallo-hydrolase [Candidatus Saccharimonadales bacterium]
MKITKLPQSCLIIEKAGYRVVIDPGSLVTKSYYARDLLPLAGVLLTHEHADHVDPELIRALNQGANDLEVIGNEDTAGAYNGLLTKVVKDGEKFKLAEFNIQARELPHCPMIDGSDGPQNTGYLIDGVFFDPGDGINIEGLSAAAAAVPIAGPDISPRDFVSFIKQINCQTVIPMHYDYFPSDPKFYQQLLSGIDGTLNVAVLADGQTTQID